VTNEDRIIVLRKIKHGEADLIIHGLNRSGAKMAFFAKAAAKSKKRFGGGVLEPTHYIRINYQDSGQEGLLRLEEARLLEDFKNLRADYERLEVALYMVSLVEKISREGVVDSPELFDLLGNALRAAETTNDLPGLRLHFQIRLLAGQGVMPDMAEAAPFLENPIKEGVRASLPPEALAALKVRVQRTLDQYLGS
jgi:DNA repair protein RecO (recombination protein O)